jgi:hypothetical protein
MLFQKYKFQESKIIPFLIFFIIIISDLDTFLYPGKKRRSPTLQKGPFWGCFTGCFVIEMALLQIKNGVFLLMGLTFMHAFRLSVGSFLGGTF